MHNNQIGLDSYIHKRSHKNCLSLLIFATEAAKVVLGKACLLLYLLLAASTS